MNLSVVVPLKVTVPELCVNVPELVQLPATFMVVGALSDPLDILTFPLIVQVPVLEEVLIVPFVSVREPVVIA